MRRHKLHRQALIYALGDRLEPLLYSFDPRYGKSDFVDTFNYLLESWKLMPRAKAKQNAQKSSSDGFGWINARLNDLDEQHLENNPPKREEIIGGLLEVAESGRSFSLKYKRDQDQFSASIFGHADGDPSLQLGLSAFADDPLLALHVVLYKYFIKLEGRFDSALVSDGGKKRFG